MITYSFNKRIAFISVLCFALSVLSLSAQINSEGLVFREAYLNEDAPSGNWIEIYNPTRQTLTLEKFRTSDIETTNILPDEIIEQGGIEIAPGASIVICADQEKTNYTGEAEIVEIEEMEYLGKGGFFSMRTKDMGDDGVDIVRYGTPAETSSLEDKLGSTVIPFSTDGNSYIRVIEEK